MAEEFEPGEVIVINTESPTATVIQKQAWRCHSCGGAVYYCALHQTDDHVDLCISTIRRRPN